MTITHHSGRGMSTDENEDFRSKNAVATSALLATYKTMLHHQTIEDDDTEALTVMMNSFELLISKNVYLPLIADAYTFTLSKLGFQTQAEEFLSKYIGRLNFVSFNFCPNYCISCIKGMWILNLEVWESMPRCMHYVLQNFISRK